MTTTRETVERVKRHLHQWANVNGIKADGRGYTATLEENLFLPLYPETEKDFEAGKGAELEGKMRALHSSSALVCNLFDYWRHRDAFWIASACGVPTGTYSLRFEVPLRTGLKGTAPHLDVALIDRIAPVFIESKFLEPYGRELSDLPFQPSYFSRSRLWEGLPMCRSLAEELSRNTGLYAYLDAPQLIKHILGLVKNRGRRFRLLYLWYDVGGPEASKHRDEVSDFSSRIDRWISFEARTHQKVIEHFRGWRGGHTRWIQYMESRYFSGESRS